MEEYKNPFEELARAQKKLRDAIIEAVSPFFIPILDFLDRLITKINRRKK